MCFWVLGSGWELDYGITTAGKFKSRLLCKSGTIHILAIRTCIYILFFFSILSFSHLVRVISQVQLCSPTNKCISYLELARAAEQRILPKHALLHGQRPL